MTDHRCGCRRCGQERDCDIRCASKCWLIGKPQRIQRRRRAGWRMLTGAVYVGRPTRWGNQFRFNPKSDTSRRVAVFHYRRWLEAMLAADTEYTRSLLAPLRGKDLACWCPLDKPCHADVLLEFANR